MMFGNITLAETVHQSFLTNLGGTIGLAVLGSVQSNIFASKLSSIIETLPVSTSPKLVSFLGSGNSVGQALATPNALASATVTNPGLVALIPSLRNAFISSVSPLFVIGFVAALTTVLLSLGISGSLKELATKRRLEQLGRESFSK